MWEEIEDDDEEDRKITYFQMCMKAIKQVLKNKITSSPNDK